jgi:hypothetical protein
MKHAKPSKQHLILLSATIFVLIAVFPIQMGKSQGSSGTIVSVVPQASTPRPGETLTINITISNVQNLYGVDVTLNWNTTVLYLLRTELRLGMGATPTGVLYNPINIAEQTGSQETGEYHIAATSENPADSFNGSGSIVVLIFNVTVAGHSDLVLQSELADHPLPDEVSAPIDHTDISGSVDAVIPEFPAIAVVGLLLFCATAALLFSKSKVATKKSPR